ncbi:MAG: endonuclease domain-containing protein [Chloroflexi bacterium]|nr:endonuclease domain-containing protein [Chloroflexota bacterium]
MPKPYQRTIRPDTHTNRVIHDDIKQRARLMRRNPTPAEAKLWQHIRKRQVRGFRFRRQHAIGPFIVDYYCYEARLVIELDGAIHDEPAQAEYDEDRQQYLESAGLRVLRFTNAQVIHDANAVVAAIGDWLFQNASCRTARFGRE